MTAAGLAQAAGKILSYRVASVQGEPMSSITPAWSCTALVPTLGPSIPVSVNIVNIRGGCA